MSMFKLSDVLSCLISWGVANLFKMRGRRGGGGLTGTQTGGSPLTPVESVIYLGLKGMGGGMGLWLRGLKPPPPPILSDYVSA